MYINFELGHFTTTSGAYGKTVTIYDDDVNQANFNPATINAEMDNHLALNYGSYFSNLWNCSYTYDRHLQTFQGS
jgi:hypothetical protein